MQKGAGYDVWSYYEVKNDRGRKIVLTVSLLKGTGYQMPSHYEVHNDRSRNIVFTFVTGLSYGEVG